MYQGQASEIFYSAYSSMAFSYPPIGLHIIPLYFLPFQENGEPRKSLWFPLSSPLRKQQLAFKAPLFYSLFSPLSPPLLAWGIPQSLSRVFRVEWGGWFLLFPPV